MVFRELARRMLVADVVMGVLLLFSYLYIRLTQVTAEAETYVVIQLGVIVVATNFLLIGLVLYTGWEPI